MGLRERLPGGGAPLATFPAKCAATARRYGIFPGQFSKLGQYRVSQKVAAPLGSQVGSLRLQAFEGRSPMSATQQSSVALRLTIVGEIGFPSASNPSDTLAGLNVSEWPDGAQAFVLSTRSLYRLNKFSTQVPVSSSVAYVAAT